MTALPVDEYSNLLVQRTAGKNADILFPSIYHPRYGRNFHVEVNAILPFAKPFDNEYGKNLRVEILNSDDADKLGSLIEHLGQQVGAELNNPIGDESKNFSMFLKVKTEGLIPETIVDGDIVTLVLKPLIYKRKIEGGKDYHTGFSWKLEKVIDVKSIPVVSTTSTIKKKKLSK